METPLDVAVGLIGGNVRTGALCGVTHEAVRRWRIRGRLPRTDYTGETDYASKISGATGGRVSREELLTLPAPAGNVQKEAA